MAQMIMNFRGNISNFYRKFLNFDRNIVRNYRLNIRNFRSKKINNNNDKNDSNKDVFSDFLKILRSFATVISISWCITRFLAEPILLQGPSMEPTIHHNDIIIAEKYTSSFRKNDYKRGDIVVVRSPMNPHQFICKRIAGLPGDTVNQGYFFDRQIIPNGHVWLLGDNKSNSTDSREFGALPMGLIIGRVIYRIWPLDSIVNFKN